MASEIPEIFYAFEPQLNSFMVVGILHKYFRRTFSSWSKTLPNLSGTMTKIAYFLSKPFWNINK